MSSEIENLPKFRPYPYHLNTFFYERFRLPFAQEHTHIDFVVKSKLTIPIYIIINSTTSKVRAKTYEHNIQEPEARRAVL